MLNHIKLSNFRCWEALDIELKPITLIFGANSSGKTALLDSLLMLKQTSESSDRGRSLCYGGYADLGSFHDLIHGHDERKRLNLLLRWEAQEDAVLRESSAGGKRPAIVGRNLEYSAAWGQEDDVSLTELYYKTNGLRFGLARNPDGRYAPEVVPEGAPGKRREGRPWPLPAPESCYALPRVVATEWPNANLLEFNHQFELLMERIRYVGPLRSHPRREYLWTGEAPTTIGADGSGTIGALLTQFRARSAGGKRRGKGWNDLVQSTAVWLKEFGLASEFEVVAIDKGGRYYEVRLVVSETSAKTALPDVGFGISQVLPVIVQLHFAPEGSILLFEQPEIHLHPRAAAVLADLFLKTAAQRNLQLIIETHSEYLLTRLQRRIAETDPNKPYEDREYPYADREHVAIYFCAPDGISSKATPIEFNLFGQIENWPEGFFGDSIGDLREMTMAAARRRRGEGDAH